MLSIKKILVPTDGSDYSYNSLRYTSSFAKEYNVKVYIMTVIEIHHSIYDVYADEITMDMQESKIASLVNQRLDETEKKAIELGIKDIVKIIRFGSPYNEIINIAKEENIDLIVMGTHGRSGIAHFLIGSVTEKVIRTAPCPVLVVRPSVHGMISDLKTGDKKLDGD
ncbi:universal stress protein [bacterium]|nr:universal stress protein [bacterium]